MSKVAVVGSGPSGWAAAQRLVELGIEVDVFSADVSPNDNSSETHAPKNFKINRKLFKGSDYPYRLFPTGPKISQSEVEVVTSFAQSGLSLVWGATMLPYQKHDIGNWCITDVDLESGYKWICSKVPIAGDIDRLVGDFPPYISHPPLLPSSRILSFLEKASKANDKNLTTGASRLAVYSVRQEKEGCLYCKQCLLGCPIDLIWKAPQIVGLANYFGGLRVLSINTMEKKHQLKVISKDGNVFTFGSYERVFLCSGPVESFRVLSTSNFVSPNAVLLDSQTFFVPILISSKYGKPDLEAHTLSQAFCYLKEGLKTKSQLQIYDYSDDLISRVYQILPITRILPMWLLKKILQRLFVGIGYLNDGDSAKILMQLNKEGHVNLSLEGSSGKSAKMIVKSMVRLYRRKFYRLGLWPLTFLTQIALPGQGVHCGGWLPMGFKSDRLGQPNASQGIHVLDSSILPSIPAGPITFTVMANAVRIIEELYE